MASEINDRDIVLGLERRLSQMVGSRSDSAQYYLNAALQALRWLEVARRRQAAGAGRTDVQELGRTDAGGS